MKNEFDVILIGAGAAGLYCAGRLGQRGLRVLVLDHARRIGEKIRISGGGRCNFTNLQGDDPARYLSSDPHFVRHALRAHPPARFIGLLREARIGFHEKHRGQLFCDASSQGIIDLLLSICAQGRVDIRHPVTVMDVVPEHRAGQAGFRVDSSLGEFRAAKVVIATGGLSIPAIGASDHAWKLAARWGMETVSPRPGLVPLTMTSAAWQPFAGLSGVALPVSVSVDLADASAAAGRAGQKGRRNAPRSMAFEEDLLFTHRGLSGPAALQISSYWQPGRSLRVDLLPQVVDAGQLLVDLKAGRLDRLPVPPQAQSRDEAARSRRGSRPFSGGPERATHRAHAAVPGAGRAARAGQGGASADEGSGADLCSLWPGQPHRQQLGTVLSALLPGRLVKVWLHAAHALLPAPFAALAGLEEGLKLAEVSDARLRLLGQALKQWPLVPAGSEGYRKAEVTVGGVATTELNPRTMEAGRVPGSYWIGEAVDVTGWLGGYNFQWAWASGWLAAEAIAAGTGLEDDR